VEERLEDRPHEPVEDRVDAASAGAVVKGGAIRLGAVDGLQTHAWHTRACEGRYSAPMAVDVARTLRGALAGALAAGVWSAQSQLDRRAFGVDCDDTELLGKAVTRGPAWLPIGVAMHLANGAAFGAVYANVAPAMPLPPWARGPLAGLAEQLATWPLVVAIDRAHPAREELPTLWGNRAAFLQGTWRRLLFGVVMGEIERRLNTPEPEPPSPYEDIFSSNGHGSLEAAVETAS
jgi:hypothetical protein